MNYSRNFWQWGSTGGDAPQLPGLGGAVEIGGESAGQRADSLQREHAEHASRAIWDGQDNMIKDDVTIIKGNHLIQVGGSYQRNYDYHSRTDNGQGINNSIVYQVTSSNINFGSFTYPTSVPTNQQTNFNTYYSYVLGLVSQSQLVYTRSGSNLALGPIGSSAVDQSMIPSYNIYFADTWHIKPSVTLSYGLSYSWKCRRYEANGKQVSLVYQDGSPVDAADYHGAAQQGGAGRLGVQPDSRLRHGQQHRLGQQVSRTIPSTAASARAFSVAWNPKFNDGILGKLLGENNTVLRAGYGRLFGRLNGVNLLLVPLLPPGLLQAVSCTGVSRTRRQCLGSNGVDPSTAFRIGPDGMSRSPAHRFADAAASPIIPGVGGNAGASRCHGARSQVSAGTHRQPDGQHTAPDQQDGQHGSRLHRPHHPQRNASRSIWIRCRT